MITERQKSLYNFLLDKAATNEFISKTEICKSLKELYRRDLEKSSEHNSYAYAQIRKDVRAINQSELEHIIISSPRGYKIATEEEAVEFVNSRFKRDLSSLKIVWNLKRKIGLDGQMKIESNSNLKEVETFIRGEKNGW